MDITDELFLEEIRNWLGILPVEFVIIVFSLIQEAHLVYSSMSTTLETTYNHRMGFFNLSSFKIKIKFISNLSTIK